MTNETEIKCPKCNGHGRVRRTHSRSGRISRYFCDRCKGIGRIKFGDMQSFEAFAGTIVTKKHYERVQSVL